MNKLIFWIIIIILWILLGLWLCNKYICGFTPAAAVPAAAAAAAVIPAKDACAGPWKFNDQKLFTQKANDFIQFTRSDFNKINQTSSVTTAVTKTADYLKANPKRLLTITGYYDTAEKNSSILPNLGEARANTIKSWLSSLGVAPKQLNIKGQTLKNNCFKGDTLRKSVAFNFAQASNDNSRVAGIKSRLVGKPLTVYFATNSDNINLTTQQRTDISDMIYYLDNVPGSGVGVSGHTDSVGNRDYNVNLSQNRAEFVKNYLIKNGGMSQSRMTVKGHGPDKPIQTNATAEGRSKNRRVEVTLK